MKTNIFLVHILLCSMNRGQSIPVPINATSRQNAQLDLVQYESYDTGAGHKFSYITADGQNREEELFILNKGTAEEEIVIKGSYSYVGSDGLIYEVKYIADRNGYNATVEEPFAFEQIEIAIAQFPPETVNSQVLASLVG